MNLRTNITPKISPKSIRYEDPILMLGSCFSIEIGEKLKELAYQVSLNPFGITFNSASISTCIRACTVGDSLLQNEVFSQNSFWAHSDFHSSFSHPERSVVEKRIIAAQASTSSYLKKTKIVAITLGTAFVFEDQKCREIVNNCHKRPNSDFKRLLLTQEDIVHHLESIRSDIDDYSNNNVRYIITVSPVRHIRDGLIENQRSKSICVSAAHHFCDAHDNAEYFPSYEVMMDDLRDYRFYNDDLIHPSSKAVDYIYSIFEESFLDENERKLRARVAKINSARKHKPLFPESESYKKFELNLKEQIEALKKDYPTIEFPF